MNRTNKIFNLTHFLRKQAICEGCLDVDILYKFLSIIYSYYGIDLCIFYDNFYEHYYITRVSKTYATKEYSVLPVDDKIVPISFGNQYDDVIFECCLYEKGVSIKINLDISILEELFSPRLLIVARNADEEAIYKWWNVARTTEYEFRNDPN